MTEPSQSIIVVVASRSLARVIQLFGVYVVIHGHYSPGGGFQGGALLAAGFILLRMTEGMKGSQLEFPSYLGIPTACVGALIFIVVGLMTMAGGAVFLDYAGLAMAGVSVEWIRHYAILAVEIGIALAVATALVSIYDDLVGGPEND